MTIRTIGGSPTTDWPASNTEIGKEVTLDTLKEIGYGINQIRYLLKGDRETCCELFRQAFDKGDAVSQIALSYAFSGMKGGEDEKKDFSSLAPENLEDFSYYPKSFVHWTSLYREANINSGHDSNWRTKKAFEIFTSAAIRHYPPAVFELAVRKWEGKLGSYGFASELRPFVGKGDKEIDYYFGKALKDGCRPCSPRYDEGLYWMEISEGIDVRYPSKGQNFASFVKKHAWCQSREKAYQHHEFVDIGGSVILAPSVDVWKVFRRHLLYRVHIAPPDSYLLKSKLEEVTTLIFQHKITATAKKGSGIDTLTVYINDITAGEIFFHCFAPEIRSAVDNPNIQPVVDFIVEVMQRTGCVYAACVWMRQLEGEKRKADLELL